MSYNFMVFYDEHKTTPARGAVFQVSDIEPGVTDEHRGCGDRVTLEPYAEDEQLRAEPAQAQEQYELIIEDLAQIHAELAQAQIDKKLAQQGHLAAAQEIIDLRTELTDIRAARDALTRELKRVDKLNRGQRVKLGEIYAELGETKSLVVASYADLAQAREELAAETRAATMWHGIAQERKDRLDREYQMNEATLAELTRVRQDAQDQSDEMERLHQKAEQRAENLYAVLLDVHKVLTDDLLTSPPALGKHWRGERATQKALQEICKLAKTAQCDMSDVIEYGDMDKMQEEREALESIEIKLQAILRYTHEALEYRTETQELWLSPCEAEGLRRQLIEAEAQLAAVKEAVQWLWGFWDGNSLRAIPGFEDDIREAWDRLLVESVASPAAAKLLERLMMAETKLNCLRTATTTVERLATLDAAEAALADCGSRGIYTKFDNPADAIMQMAARIERLEDETMIEVEITEKEIVQALQAERQLRQEAEHELVMAEDLLKVTRRRAKDTEVELERGHRTLTHLGVPPGDESGELPITGCIEITRRIEQMLRTERQLRREAEQESKQRQRQINLLSGAELRAHRAGQRSEDFCTALLDVHKVLDKYQVVTSTENAETRVAQLGQCLEEAEQRAERAEAANDHLRSVASQIPYLKDRCERAEALAAPVNEGTADLLERLAGYARRAARAAKGSPDDVDEAYNDEEITRVLAAEIREVLDDSQA